LGKAARATRTVSGGTGSIGMGRSMTHLHVYTRNLLDAEASYQCFQDFASSIRFGEVESMGTSAREMETLPLRNSAVFRTLLRPRKLGQTSNPPHFTKSGQEPDLTCKTPLVVGHQVLRLSG